MTTCYSWPSSPGIPATPSATIRHIELAWDSGADSTDQFDGDLALLATMSNPVVGVIGGLKNSRAGTSIPELINYGFIFQPNALDNYYAVIENGVLQTSLQLRDGSFTEVFQVRRVAGYVRYFVNGTLLYSSATRSFGPMITSSCLYASGDTFG